MKAYVAIALSCLVTSSIVALAQEERPGAPATTIAPVAPPAAAPAPLAPAVANNPDYAAVQEGKPVDTRLNENVRDKPLYPEQTRAPYHKTTPYQTTEITSGLHAPWALGFLPDGKFLVTEKLPGALRVIDAAGNIAPPVSGVDGLATGWAQTGLLDLVIDPKFS